MNHRLLISKSVVLLRIHSAKKRSMGAVFFDCTNTHVKGKYRYYSVSQGMNYSCSCQVHAQLADYELLSQVF